MSKKIYFGPGCSRVALPTKSAVLHQDLELQMFNFSADGVNILNKISFL